MKCGERVHGDNDDEDGDNDDEDEDKFAIFENVCLDDVDAAESTALAKSNGGIPQGKNVKNLSTRQYVSAAEYFTFRFKSRDELPCRFMGNSGKLGQLYICDAFNRVSEMRMDVIASRKAEYALALNRSALFEHLNKKVNQNLKTELGMLVTVPSKLPGSPKYMRELVMSAVQTSNDLGHPDFFITFTESPHWDKIKSNIPPGCDWADCPDLVVSLFWNKVSEFLEDVLGKRVKSSKDNGKMMRQPGCFGQVAWYTFSVEFQQRLNVLNFASECICFKIKNNKWYYFFEKKKHYRDCVIAMMLHSPCEGDHSANFNQGRKPTWKRCTKDFPKAFSDTKIYIDNMYPTYKRSRGNSHVFFRNGKMLKADSSYGVAHNPYLLTKYESHINVEVVSNIHMMKYMFNYIFKGSDRAIVEACEEFGFADDGSIVGGHSSLTITGELLGASHVPAATIEKRRKTVTQLMKDNGVEPVNSNGTMKAALNECYYYQDYRAITAPEALWRIQGRAIPGSSHTANRAFVHQEGEELIIFKRGEAEKALRKNEKYEPKTMFTAWFDANKNPVRLPDGLQTTDLTYEEMFSFFKYDAVQKKFVLRKKDYSRHILARIQTPQPWFLELTAVRLLVKDLRGCTSFEDLRTYEGEVYETCLDRAAKKWPMLFVISAGF